MNLEWDKLDLLAIEFGNSYYLLDLVTFQNNYLELLNSFTRRYPKTNLAYSYKANYIPALCAKVDRLGGYAEVVSWMEYELAKRVGVIPERIIFNGPYKEPEEIIQALCEGAVVNIDSHYEIAAVEKATSQCEGKPVRVGLRLNLALDNEEGSRFGFDTSSDPFAAVVNRVRAIPNCEIVGLHCHLLTARRTPDNYRQLAIMMLDVVDSYFTDQPLAFIDIGGGFFSKMSDELRSSFSFPIPNYQEYADAIAPIFSERFNQDGPELILEPGISITADIMKFVSRIVDLKVIREKSYALLAGSVYNIKPTKAARQLPMSIINRAVVTNHPPVPVGKPIDIVGYTCMEDDIMYKEYSDSINLGDFAVFDNVGSYTVVLKPPFIMPAPPILEVDQNFEISSVIRRQEKMTDIFATYNFNNLRA